ncbi:MAG: hypothetical protein CVT66_06200 [Actinobacteria bacterium HGW-Actinobacteria-6]|nr:MAG: hypothetical protein CVT66_06200 [Actinobacteria bacterium HGW-Actinobacteria-6]
MTERLCAWCNGPIRAAARRDAITCSTSCRQARNRFAQGVGSPPPVAGGRPLRLASRSGSGHDASRGSSRRIDSLVYRPGVRTTDPNRVIGAKPAVFIRWVFDLLGALPGDELVDVFPGSGGVGRAWELYTKAGA